MTNKQITDSSNANGNGKQSGTGDVKDFNTVWVPPENAAPIPPFEPDNQPIVLERPAWWSHSFVWLILVITGSALAWAAFAPIEQSVPVTGKLEPEGAAKEIKAPNGGVVREILVKNGQKVYKDQLLVKLDPTSPQADLDSLRKQRETLIQENAFYNGQFNGVISGGSPELQALLKSKVSLLQEIEYYKAILSKGTALPKAGDDFSVNQQGLLRANRAERDSRIEAARLQIGDLQKQLEQVNTQLQANQYLLQMAQQQEKIAIDRVAAAQQQMQMTEQQIIPNLILQARTAQEQLAKAQQQREMTGALLLTDRELLAKIEPVARDGALSQLQLTRQQQQVLSRQNDVAQSESEILTRANEIQSKNAEILARRNDLQTLRGELGSRISEVGSRKADTTKTKAEIVRLQQEGQRLNLEIDRANQQLQNAIALSDKEIASKIADNQQRVADIDSQLARLRLENQKKLDEIESSLQKAQQAVQYQELRAPVDGVVFDLKPTGAGYVVRAIDNEPVLKIVPNDGLVASVNLTNRDIGFVKENMEVEVNVEPFPSTEFGTIHGKIVSIGKDALEPTQERPYYAFPVRIQLDKQSVGGTNGQRVYPLQSGMAVNASIKVRNRTVLSIFTELFQKQVDSLESVR